MQRPLLIPITSPSCLRRPPARHRALLSHSSGLVIPPAAPHAAFSSIPRELTPQDLRHRHSSYRGVDIHPTGA
jgi:hypothetical protein